MAARASSGGPIAGGTPDVDAALGSGLLVACLELLGCSRHHYARDRSQAVGPTPVGAKPDGYSSRGGPVDVLPVLDGPSRRGRPRTWSVQSSIRPRLRPM